MTNFIVIWAREHKEGFDFINDKDMDEAISQWLNKQCDPNTHGSLLKMLITETSNTYKVPIELEQYSSYRGYTFGNNDSVLDEGIDKTSNYIKIMAVLEEVANMEINLGSKDGRKLLARKIKHALDTPLSREQIVKSYKELTNER